jgi:hypothetical protein
MKFKTLPVLMATAGLILGFTLGRLQARHSLREASEIFRGLQMASATNACADFSHTAGMLVALRRGDTNEAIETLECDLDMHISTIALGLVDVPIEAQNSQFLSRVTWYRKYRADHPHEDTSTLSQHALSLLRTNK